MNKLIIAIIGLCTVAAGGIFSQTPVPNNFIAPLEIPASISGTFGELRSNHFHSGVDFTTNGKNGYKVRAVADGYVSRIKISPVGYGKALYITHYNGYTTVYGHLDKFVGRIDSFVMAKHYELERFDMDVYLKAGELTVTSGQTVALSGNSGSSSGPHLHFEVRDTKSEKALNPFLFRRDAADNVKPVIAGMCIYPMDVQSTALGQREPKYMKVVKVNQEFKLEGDPMPTAAGRIGFGIETFDYLSGAMRKCGVYAITLSVNGQKVFKSEMNGFFFDETRYINSLIDYKSKILHSRNIQKSFIDPNNKLGIYQHRMGDGTVDIEPEKTYSIEYEVVDIYGNTSLLRFKLKGVEKSKQAGLVDKNVNALDYRKSHQLENDGIKVNLPANCFYKNEVFLFEKAGNGPIADVWRVGERSVPLHIPMAVAIKVPEKHKANVKQMCLARKDASGKLIYAGGKAESGWISGNIRETGLYTLAIDSIKPSVSIKNPAPDNNYKEKSLLTLTVTDNFSGIAAYRCLVNNQWALFEYDAKTNQLVCSLTRLGIDKNKTHTLTVEVTDGCGNTTTRNWKFQY